MTDPSPIRAAVLTVSDRCSRAESVDTSGPALASLLTQRLGAHVLQQACLPDDLAKLSAQFQSWSSPQAGIDLIVSTGGTGVAPRDVTPEAASAVIQRPHPGLMELARARTAAHTPLTYLSRGVAGICNRTLIITLPGSLRACTQQLEALIDVLPHAIQLIRGYDDPHPPLR